MWRRRIVIWVSLRVGQRKKSRMSSSIRVSRGRPKQQKTDGPTRPFGSERWRCPKFPREAIFIPSVNNWSVLDCFRHLFLKQIVNELFIPFFFQGSIDLLLGWDRSSFQVVLSKSRKSEPTLHTRVCLFRLGVKLSGQLYFHFFHYHGSRGDQCWLTISLASHAATSFRVCPFVPNEAVFACRSCRLSP
jgi:hypothetical protein